MSSHAMLTSYAGMDVPRTSRIFSQFQVYLNVNPDKTNDKFITSWSFLSSDVMPTSSKEKESDELLFGRSLRSASQLPAQGVN